jgi:hypothetical protein
MTPIRLLTGMGLQEVNSWPARPKAGENCGGEGVEGSEATSDFGEMEDRLKGTTLEDLGENVVREFI